MIVDKKNKTVISDNQTSILAPKPEIPVYEVPEQVEANGAVDVLHAIIDIVKQVTWQYGVKDSPKIFNTVQYDDGQYERIIHKKANMEEGIAFPAAFVHFIQCTWSTTMQRFNEGHVLLRIRFILNRLDTHNPEHDTDVYYVSERINQTIQQLRKNYPCLDKRCMLTYVDPMESFDNSLQPCWMTYEIWFTTVNVWVSRLRTTRRIVCPPFTNHADQNQDDPENNLHNHTNLSHPVTYDEATAFSEKVPPEQLPDTEENT